MMVTLVGTPGLAAGMVTTFVPGADRSEHPAALHAVTYRYSVCPTVVVSVLVTVVAGAVTTASGVPAGTAVSGVVLAYTLYEVTAFGDPASGIPFASFTGATHDPATPSLTDWANDTLVSRAARMPARMRTISPRSLRSRH